MDDGFEYNWPKPEYDLIHSWNDVDEDHIPKHAEADPTNPSYYKSESGLESMDFVEAFIAPLSGYEAFFTGNILKYMVRWHSKNGVEDLKKARWYLDRLISNIENQDEKGE